MRYRVVGRCTDGVKVTHYLLEDLSNGNKFMMDKEYTSKLVLDKQVVNCVGQVYDGKVYIKGLGCRLTDLPRYNEKGQLIKKVSKEKEIKGKYMLLKRVLDGKRIVGYVVGDIHSKATRKMDRESVIKLARCGEVINARVQSSNGKYLLRGVNCELAQLPLVKVG